MSRTVILINPMGADITLLVATLLRGTILQPGDSLYTLPYNNTYGATNIAGGVTLLDDKLNETAGDILIVAYSEGCQVATKWMRDHGQGSPITPTSRMTFLLIANSERKYGGVLYGHASFSLIADTAGLPPVVPYAVTDFCRQYDGFADFPTGATDIQTALDQFDNPSGDNAIALAVQEIWHELADNGDEVVALANAYAGMSLIHDNYFNVTVDATDNISYSDVTSPNVTYVWAPTYPVPLLGTNTLFSDQQYRTIIERFYDRPAAIPMPDYADGVAGWNRKPPVTGWWAEPFTEPRHALPMQFPFRLQQRTSLAGVVLPSPLPFGLNAKS